MAVKLSKESTICLTSGRKWKKNMRIRNYKKGIAELESQLSWNSEKDYFPFEESNIKFYKSGIGTKVPPDIK